MRQSQHVAASVVSLLWQVGVRPQGACQVLVCADLDLPVRDLVCVYENTGEKKDAVKVKNILLRMRISWQAVLRGHFNFPDIFISCYKPIAVITWKWKLLKTYREIPSLYSESMQNPTNPVKLRLETALIRSRWCSVLLLKQQSTWFWQQDCSKEKQNCFLQKFSKLYCSQGPHRAVRAYPKEAECCFTPIRTCCSTFCLLSLFLKP
nr:uncharacterized protein LOC106045268 isoform X2 [Anser cygnoides]